MHDCVLHRTKHPKYFKRQQWLVLVVMQHLCLFISKCPACMQTRIECYFKHRGEQDYSRAVSDRGDMVYTELAMQPFCYALVETDLVPHVLARTVVDVVD